MKKLGIYVDTSVIGGCFDEEFAEESRALIEMAQKEWGDPGIGVSPQE